MEIQPTLQLALLLSSFLAGVVMGLFYEVLTATRIVMGAYLPPAFMRERYEKPLPWLGRGVPFRGGRTMRRVWRAVVIGVGDCLFCVLFALAVILLLYRYNDGAFRPSSPALALVGFGLFRVISVRLIAPVLAYIAFFLGAFLLYVRAVLRLPVRGARYVFLRWIRPPAVRLRRAWQRRRWQRKSAALCAAQLAWADAGFAGSCPRAVKRREKPRGGRKRKGSVPHGQTENTRKDHSLAVGDPHPHFGDLLCVADHRSQSADGVESVAPARGGIGARKRGTGRSG